MWNNEGVYYSKLAWVSVKLGIHLGVYVCVDETSPVAVLIETEMSGVYRIIANSPTV